MESGQLVFSTPSTLKYPFWTKTTKAVLKSFHENETTAFTGLKEFKPITVFAVESADTLPEADDLASVFTEHKLKADSLSFQLRYTFDKVPNNLLLEESKARTRLARSLTLQLQLEALLEANPSQKELAVSCKLNAATYGEHLSVFITAERKCRSSVLGKAAIKHEIRMLIEDCFLPEPLP